MKYYSIYKIGDILTRESFLRQRLQAASWVHHDEFVKKIIKGEYDSILPLHVEVCSTYRCNFNCSWCNCKKSRLREDKAKDELSYDELKRIIEDFKENDIGIQWTGGEPLLNSSTIRGINYGTKLGLRQCLFTNGSLLDEDSISTVLLSNMEFIRISLNCANPIYHSRFHGGIPQELSKKVCENINKLCYYKLMINSRVKIGVSLVVDSRNIDDFLNTYDYIKAIATRYPFALNYIIVRAVNEDFDGIETEKDENFTSKYKKTISKLEIEKMGKLGVETILPNEENESYNSTINKQCGCSVFSEVSPNGLIFLCSDKYGDKNYSVGNILVNSISDIWMSMKKKEVEERNKDCFLLGRCPRFSRGWYFNTVFSQVEEYRSIGRMYIVEDWIQGLKETIPFYNHSFYI